MSISSAITYIVDLRWLLFALGRLAVLPHPRLFQGLAPLSFDAAVARLALVSLFIWFSENIGTFTKTWLYPSQRLGWSMVSIDKLGSWFLLLIISYTLVSLVNAPRERLPLEAAVAGAPMPLP